MLSILIPTYNYNILDLVSTLKQQADDLNIIYEIITIDDASFSELNTCNQNINNFENCTFESLTKNIGRSAIRNLLANRASFEWLLFLDADVFPKSKSFLQNYIQSFTNNTSIILGGIVYKQGDDSEKLRWKIGKKGEEQTIKIRQSSPNKFFFTGNFAIKKSTLLTFSFDETIKTYGYEDTLLAKQLLAHQYNFTHIDNAVYHLGIDDNIYFITKTKQAIENIVILIRKGTFKHDDTKITNTYLKAQTFFIPQLLSVFNKTLEKKAIQNSSLFYYNLFRLGYLHKIFKNLK